MNGKSQETNLANENKQQESLYVQIMIALKLRKRAGNPLPTLGNEKYQVTLQIEVYEKQDDVLEPEDEITDDDLKDSLKYGYDFKAANPDQTAPTDEQIKALMNQIYLKSSLDSFHKNKDKIYVTRVATMQKRSMLHQFYHRFLIDLIHFFAPGSKWLLKKQLTQTVNIRLIDNFDNAAYAL